MPTLAVLALAVIGFAVFLRFWFYVDLEDGLVLGLVFCGIFWLIAHLAVTR